MAAMDGPRGDPDPEPDATAGGHRRLPPSRRWPTVSGSCTRTGARGEYGSHRYSYTSPSPHRYPWQWYWDSCLTSIAWRHFDPSRSRSELESLLQAATPEGFIGHTIFWGQPVPFPRRLYYNISSPADPMTATIQPPLLAWAWRIAVGDPSLEPRIRAHHELISAQRDLDGDGLLWIIQPDETGPDASPVVRCGLGMAGGRAARLCPARAAQPHLHFDIQRIRQAGGPLVCSPLVNVMHGLSRMALGLPSITPVLVDRLYDADPGLFGQLVWPERDCPVVATWAALSPLALPDLPEGDRPPAGGGAPPQSRAVLAARPSPLCIRR